MAVDLFDLNEEQPVPAGLTIERVEDTKSLTKWDYASIHGFGMPEIGINTWFDLFAGLGFELPVRNYVGILNGEPVAASQLFLDAGVAGIYMVATIPEARGKGIGTAMTVRPLLEARAMGYRIGVLQSSLMAVDVYRRLGFREYRKFSSSRIVIPMTGGKRNLGFAKERFLVASLCRNDSCDQIGNY